MRRDKLLFTPGPLTTSATVKRAMRRDVGSRDGEMIGVIRDIRRKLLAVAGVSREQGYETVLFQGSGTYAVEAVLTSAAPSDGHWLIVVNGAYGKRMAQIAAVHRLRHTVLECPEDVRPSPAAVDAALWERPDVTGVAVVHCETTTGILNPVEEIGAVVKRHGKTYVVDSMSAFGGIEIDLAASCADFLISSANKCLEGVPGVAFVLCRHEPLERTRGGARTLSLDLFAQWQALEETGQFRFTPPTHVLLALQQALLELEAEGGVSARAARYRRNHETLVVGMRRLGFDAYLPAARQSPIITSFRYPDEGFDFDAFYGRLSAQGVVIYPGKVTRANCFRIGTIGHISDEDIATLLRAIDETRQCSDGEAVACRSNCRH